MALSATVCHMSLPQQINQRDLRLRSREIMDAVEHGEKFTVTRDGREIAELVPLVGRKRFISREEFVRGSQGLPVIDPDRFRADIDAAIDPDVSDPFERARG